MTHELKVALADLIDWLAPRLFILSAVATYFTLTDPMTPDLLHSILLWWNGAMAALCTFGFACRVLADVEIDEAIASGADDPRT